ncbi:MAG TPA: NADH-quinone oxidoreductase subunit A [Cytophagaceae bacterium]|jgi:NADH-quinone oxidoreductase subunit A|nr:NADH-quinone oxidoreductase subunit A [Cytophagaceae bacterium]
MIQTEISEFGNILLFILGGIAFVVIALTVASLIRPKRPNEEKLAPYECGEEAVGSPWTNFNVRFYIIALIFVLFEVEIIFLFPWAVVFGNAELIRQTNGLWGWVSMAEVFLFVFILAIGLIYAWVKGYLDWVQPDPDPEKFESKVPQNLYEAVNKKYEK